MKKLPFPKVSEDNISYNQERIDEEGIFLISTNDIFNKENVVTIIYENTTQKFVVKTMEEFNKQIEQFHNDFENNNDIVLEVSIKTPREEFRIIGQDEWDEGETTSYACGETLLKPNSSIAIQ